MSYLLVCINVMSIVKTNQERRYQQFSSIKGGTLNIISLAFWVIFALNYLYLNRILVVITYERFRLGIFILSISLLVILLSQRVVKNSILAYSIITLSGIILISAWINQIPFLQFLAFFRIPIIVYLIYNIVVCYFNTDKRVIRVLQIFYIIAALQLPIIAFQRYAYTWLPSSLIYITSLTDFGTGTFSGDTAMAFALIGLVILLLFNNKVKKIIKQRWLLAAWLSLTILFSNSQIHHVTIGLVWVIYFLSHMKARDLIIGCSILLVVTGMIVLTSQSNLMTYPFLYNTIAQISNISSVLDENINYDVFFSGGHDRIAAISYYIHQPIKLIGDGPGSVYDTSSGQRTVGGWGHFFTFYAEVGLLGYLFSILIFFVIAFPIIMMKSSLRIRTSWVGALMFLSIFIVTFVKYPMGDTVMVFTYCIILIAHQVLTPSKYSINV